MLLHLKKKVGFNPLTHGRFFRLIFQSALRGVKLFFFSWRHTQQKVLQGQEVLGMGCLYVQNKIESGSDPSVTNGSEPDPDPGSGPVWIRNPAVSSLIQRRKDLRCYPATK